MCILYLVAMEEEKIKPFGMSINLTMFYKNAKRLLITTIIIIIINKNGS